MLLRLDTAEIKATDASARARSLTNDVKDLGGLKMRRFAQQSFTVTAFVVVLSGVVVVV